MTEANQLLLRSTVFNVSVSSVLNENGTRWFTFNIRMSKYDDTDPEALEEEMNSILLKEDFVGRLILPLTIDIYCKFFTLSVCHLSI